MGHCICACTVLGWIAEGKIPWGFWPPGGSVSTDHGVWLNDGAQRHACDELEMGEEKSGGSDDEDDDDEKPAIRR